MSASAVLLTLIFSQRDKNLCEEFAKNGVLFAGTSPDNHIVEMMEIPAHPWFVACQFHPEFKSRPNRPHPLFRGFVSAAAKRCDEKDM